jgi:hypothetical protein
MRTAMTIVRGVPQILHAAIQIFVSFLTTMLTFQLDVWLCPFVTYVVTIFEEPVRTFPVLPQAFQGHVGYDRSPATASAFMATARGTLQAFWAKKPQEKKVVLVDLVEDDAQKSLLPHKDDPPKAAEQQQRAQANQTHSEIQQASDVAIDKPFPSQVFFSEL